MENSNVAFGKVLASLRQSARLSQEELAERADIHRTYVSQVERGLKSPTLIVLFRLASALETTPSRILKQVEAKVSL
ncbi:XRE family transcriptional regulator [Tardiphaga alba]|uniref:XRE family transcriptional regulator n=1 Tax=Tardiphaga alba TaxID=340268 RepID=A0ABX8A5D9_9BRAD|nr:helix-turn-helix transcriptional regulator [Tardiphaga alba]QUS38848.1 XRE family transcriptional regulator [Tardiphaga alba]